MNIYNFLCPKCFQFALIKLNYKLKDTIEIECNNCKFKENLPKTQRFPQHILGCLTKNMYEAWCFAVKTLILHLIYITLSKL